MNSDPSYKEPLPQDDLKEAPARRHFIKGMIGISAGVGLLLAGTIDKIYFFFFGPRLSQQEETELMQQRLDRLKSTIGIRQLELEREESEHILVAQLSELDKTTGKYFVDYQMRPALAFLGKDGLPTLISAKCTHLGCTVGNQCNAQGKILCPCHVSYFDVTTGQPDPGAPAKAPLPHLGWVIKDKTGKVRTSRLASGQTTGDTNAGALDGASVYIAKKEA